MSAGHGSYSYQQVAATTIAGRLQRVGHAFMAVDVARLMPRDHAGPAGRRSKSDADGHERLRPIPEAFGRLAAAAARADTNGPADRQAIQG